MPHAETGVTVPGDRRAVLAQRPLRAPGPGEVTVRVRLSGICGSDLHKYRLSAAERGAGASRFIGHEAVGVVDRLGAGVARDLLGRRVVVYHAWGGADVADGDDKRSRALSIMGVDVDGGNASAQVVPAAKLLAVPDELTDADAVLSVCNLGTAWSALERVQAGPGTTVGVWGLGPVGLCAVLLGRQRGARVVGVDVVASRRAAAAALGAERVADGAAQDLRDAIGEPLDIVIETSGAAAAHRAVPDLVRHRGRVALVGMRPGAELALRPVQLHELRLEGVFLYDQADWPRIVADAARLDIAPGTLVSDRFAPHEAAAAFALADSALATKVAVDWSSA